MAGRHDARNRSGGVLEVACRTVHGGLGERKWAYWRGSKMMVPGRRRMNQGYRTTPVDLETMMVAAVRRRGGGACRSETAKTRARCMQEGEIVARGNNPPAKMKFKKYFVRTVAVYIIEFC